MANATSFSRSRKAKRRKKLLRHGGKVGKKIGELIRGECHFFLAKSKGEEKKEATAPLRESGGIKFEN